MENSISYQIGFGIGLMISVGIIVSIIGVVMILLRPPRFCQRCGRPMPKFTMARSVRQALSGSRTCPDCGCEVDKNGVRLKDEKQKSLKPLEEEQGKATAVRRYCRKCGNELLGRRGYCRKCDDVKTIPCPSCSRYTPENEESCVYCGANVK